MFVQPIQHFRVLYATFKVEQQNNQEVIRQSLNIGFKTKLF